MRIHLKDLTYFSDLDLLKTILSSADKFPGLYRLTSSWQQSFQSNDFLKLMTFLEAIFHSEKGKKWRKNEWLDSHLKLFDLAYGKGSRNEEREDGELKKILKEKGFLWFNTPQSFSLALIDNETHVRKIEQGRSYYMMGSILHFEEERTLISYNDFNKTYALELKVSFRDVTHYIDKAFGPTSLSELFFFAEIIGQLDFDSNDLGELKYDQEQVNSLLQNYPGNCSIFATVNYPEILPIRFAKLIGVTNVCK